MMARIDPLSKLGVAIVYVVAASVSESFVLLGGMALLVTVLLLVVESVSPWRLARALLPFALFALCSSWIYAVAPDPSYRAIGGSGWTVAALVGLRTVTVGLVSIAFALTTDPADLARALIARLRLPRRFVHGALAAVQFLPGLAEEARIARLTARAGLPPGVSAPRRFATGLHPGIGMVLLAGAVRRANAAALAMELRGLGAARAPLTWRVPRFRWRDAVFVGLAAALAGLWSAG